MTTDTTLWPWNRPFFEGGEEARDYGRHPVAINGQEYMVDLTLNAYVRRSVQVLRTRQNAQPNENLLLEPEVWRTTVESWHQGAGQTRADRNESLPYRFYSSRGIDPWDEWGISLLNATELASDAGGAQDGLLLATFDRIWFASGDTLTQWESGYANEQTETLPGSVVSAVTDGNHLFVLCDDDTVYRYDAAVRSMISWAYNRIVALLFRVRVRDVDCAFKLMRAEVRDKLPLQTDDFFIDTEIVASARKWNFRIGEKGVRHYPRVAGETTVTAGDVPRTLRTIGRMWRRIYVPSPAQRREAEKTKQAVHAVELLPTSAESE